MGKVEFLFTAAPRRRGRRKLSKPGAAWAAFLAFAALAGGLLIGDACAGAIETDPRVLERLDRLVDEYCREPVSRHIFNVKTGQVELGPNMAPNPGFEEVWGDPGREVPEGEEWREGIAYGWNVLPRMWEAGGVTDTVEHPGGHEKFGRRSGRLRYVSGGGNAYYGAVARLGPGASPGDAYLVRSYAKTRLEGVSMETFPRVWMQVRWLPRLPAHETTVELRRHGEWTLMETVAMLPEGNPHSMFVMLRADGLKPGMEALFDNFSVQLIRE